MVLSSSSSDEEEFEKWKAAQKSAQKSNLQKYLEESRQVRRQQDKEFAESLAIDQLKVHKVCSGLYGCLTGNKSQRCILGIEQ